jgi:thiamine biosynthesis lipoprotein
MPTLLEATDSFPCFGGTCGAFVIGDGRLGQPEDAVAHVRRRLTGWHSRFSRFEPDSELSALNADPRTTVPVSATMLRFAAAVVQAASETGGLVDATLLEPLEEAGYRTDLGAPVPLELALHLVRTRRPARPRAESSWSTISVDRAGQTVTRPVGVRLDSGGLAKGLFADILAGELRRHASFAIDCAGDLRIGGAKAIPRAVRVASPFGERVLHEFELSDAGVATSGIGRRSWLDDRGVPAHHLLDPATGRPAFTGVVQATALAPTALGAEILAKAAVLSGAESARSWLVHGGVLVYDDGEFEIVDSTLAA